MSGPYLKFLPAQWFVFSQGNPHLFRPGLKLCDELEADRALKNYYGRVIESAHAYGLWRAVLDFEDNWFSEDDQLEVGRFLNKAKLSPKQFALDETKGLAKAVGRFAVPPMHEWVLDVITRLDERLGDDCDQDSAHDIIVNALAALNCGPSKVQILMDKWCSRDLVSVEEHQFVTGFLERMGFDEPDYARIRRSSARSIVVSEAAERESFARDLENLQATREAVVKKKTAERKPKRGGTKKKK